MRLIDGQHWWHEALGNSTLGRSHDVTVQVRTLASGLGFTEGPLWTSRGELWVTSLSRRCVYQVDAASGAPPAVEVASVSGSPSGLAEDRSGRVWVVHASDARAGQHHRKAVGVSVIEAGRSRLVVVDGLTAPNDCVISPDGSELFFTDPAGQAFDPHGPPGAVRALDLDTREVRTVFEGGRYPNGIAWSPEGDALYVAETAASRLLRFAYDGKDLARSTVFHLLGSGRPDGLHVTQSGHVLVATTTGDSVAVLDPAGELVTDLVLEQGCFPTNVTVGGPGSDTLFVTVAKGGRVLAVWGGPTEHPDTGRPHADRRREGGG